MSGSHAARFDYGRQDSRVLARRQRGTPAPPIDIATPAINKTGTHALTTRAPFQRSRNRGEGLIFIC